jgi:hypothetical protein
MKIKFAQVLLIFTAALLSAQTVAVENFTTTQEDIVPLMPGATDVLRSALSANSVIQLTANRNTASYVITGTVTRFGAVRPVEKTSGGSSGSGSGNIAIQLFSFLSPIVQTANSGSRDSKAGAAPPADDNSPRVVISAQMTEVKTSRIVASESIQAVTWDEYLAKSVELAAAFINRLPFPDDAFAGVWEAVVEHGNYEDTYQITFRGGGSCFVEISSTDPRNRTSRQSAEGTYSYSGNVLTVNARFRNNEISYIRQIDWKTAINLAPDNRSFSLVIPVSHVSGSERVRAVFRKN